MQKLLFDELNMNEAKEAAKAGKVIIIPVGSVEEHGNHLPLNTDSLQPEYVALKVAKKTGCLVAPSLKYGVCSSTYNFPGTISITFESLRNIIQDILQGFIRNGFKKIIILSGHAGRAHMVALRLAAQKVIRYHNATVSNRELRIMVCCDYDFAYELRDSHFNKEDGHAGTIETSRIMTIRPDLIKGKGTKSLPKLPRFEIVSNPEDYFPNGVIGDPTIASTEKGRIINDHVIAGVIRLVEELRR